VVNPTWRIPSLRPDREWLRGFTWAPRQTGEPICEKLNPAIAALQIFVYGARTEERM